MQIVHWGILLLLVTVVPFLLGMIPVKYMNKLQRTPMMSYVCGWFVSFAVFEVVAVPFILLEQSFTLVVIVYTAVIALMLVVSVWRGRSVFADFQGLMERFPALSLWTKIGWGAVLAVIGVQMAAAIFLEYYDGDDAYFVATAVVTDRFDTMYLRDNYTGFTYSLDARHALSPTPIYQAWLSRLSGIHPAIVAHSVLSVVWLLLMYGIYAQLARRLFPKQKQYRPLFILFLSVWYMFGNISLYTAETFAMTRTWQGKGLMAGCVLPALLMCLLYLVDKRPAAGVWMLFVCVIISSVFATSIAFMLVPTLVGVAAILLAWKKRSFKTFIQICVCMAPCLMLAACYVLVK